MDMELVRIEVREVMSTAVELIIEYGDIRVDLGLCSHHDLETLAAELKYAANHPLPPLK